MRVAVVDIGTNSTRLLIADVRDGAVAERDRRSLVTHLGEGVDAAGALGDAAQERVFAVLDGYAEAIGRAGCDVRLAVMTSAVRDASNGAHFAAAVAERYGLDARTLSGDQEARLTFLGATAATAHHPVPSAASLPSAAITQPDPSAATPPVPSAASHPSAATTQPVPLADSHPSAATDAQRPMLVVDIGGGSTEFVVGRGGRVDFHVSTQVGVVRHSERFLHTDPPRPEELAALRADVAAAFEAAVPAAVRAGVASAVAVAGTPTQSAAMELELEPYDPDRIEGHRLTLATLDALLHRVATVALAERCRIRGLDPARAPTIVAGIVVLATVLQTFGLEEARVSERDILWGVALDAAERDGAI